MQANRPRRLSSTVNSSADKVSNAEETAVRLLRRTLPRREWLRYTIKGYVLVRGSEGGLFRLNKEKAYGIQQLKPKKRVMCAVPEDANLIPIADVIVAQYLSIKNDEKGFIEKANLRPDYTHSPGIFVDMAQRETIEEQRIRERTLGQLYEEQRGIRAGQLYEEQRIRERTVGGLYEELRRTEGFHHMYSEITRIEREQNTLAQDFRIVRNYERHLAQGNAREIQILFSNGYSHRFVMPPAYISRPPEFI